MTYILTYILGDTSLLGAFALGLNIPMVIGLLTPSLLKSNGMYKLSLAGYTVAAVARAGVTVAGYMQNIPLMLVFTAIAALGMSPFRATSTHLLQLVPNTPTKQPEGELTARSTLALLPELR